MKESEDIPISDTRIMIMIIIVEVNRNVFKIMTIKKQISTRDICFFQAMGLFLRMV